MFDLMANPILDVANAKTARYHAVIEQRHIDILGHVNNGAYVKIFEEARWDLITRGGFGIDEVRRRKLSPIVLKMNLRFRREVLVDERVTIETQLVSYLGKIGKLEQTMKKADGSTACEAKYTIALFNLQTRHLEAPTPAWLKAIGVNQSSK